MPALTFKVDTREFNTTLAKFSVHTKRTFTQLINKKAYYVARRAIWYTHKADYQKMANELGQILRLVKSGSRSGKLTMKGRGQFNSARDYLAPLLALIINKRRGNKGEPGLYGAEMKKEFQTVFGARARSIAYLKSGWIEARDMFKPWAEGGRGLPPSEGTGIGGTKRIGRPKGGGNIAREGWNPVATIWNSSYTKRDHKDALLIYGKPALEQAIAEEDASTAVELEKRIAAEAKALGIKFG